MISATIYWDDDSDPANPGWLLRVIDDEPGYSEDVPLDTDGDEDAAANEAAGYLGWRSVIKEATRDGWALSPRPRELTVSKRLQVVGNSLCVIVDRSVADELGVDRGDWVEYTIRRVE